METDDPRDPSGLSGGGESEHLEVENTDADSIGPALAGVLREAGVSPEATERAVGIVRLYVERSIYNFPSPDVLKRLNEVFEEGGKAGFDMAVREQEFRHERIRERDRFAQEELRRTNDKSFELDREEQKTEHGLAYRGQMIAGGLGFSGIIFAFLLVLADKNAEAFMFGATGLAVIGLPFLVKVVRERRMLGQGDEDDQPKLPPPQE